jgi:sporulation protein YlmC with PRC-barrel domain
MRLSDQNLKGRTVISSDGQAIGEITSLFLDSEEWRIEAIQVGLRKETADRIGAPRSIFHPGTVEIPVRLIQSVGDAVVLSTPVDGLRQILVPVTSNTDAHP